MADGSISSSEKTAALTGLPPWVRWALPSTADLIFIALLLLLTCTQLSVRLLGDAGIGWHIRTGQQILATRTIPRVDLFSSSMPGKPWFAWEWLYDVVAGKLEAMAGLNGVTWLTAVVIGAVFSWTFRILRQRGTHIAVAVLLVLLATSASMIHFLARPHVVNWLFTLAWFWILESTERNGPLAIRSAWLWTLPPVMLLWVNVHGGFLLGFVLLGIFFLGSLWSWTATKESRIEESLQKIAAAKRARQLVWAGLASAAASLINPYGWKLHAHIYSYLSNRFLMSHIDEFQSPNFHGIAQECFLLLVLISLAALAARGRDLRLSETLAVLLAVATGLYSSRNIPVSSILLAIIVGPILAGDRFPGQFFERMSKVESQLRGHLWPVVAAVALFLIAVNGGKLGPAQLMDAHFDPHRMPVAAVDQMDKDDLPGPILTPDYWGGYVIYRLYPRAQVVVDDRHDFYGGEFFRSYLKMMHVERGWDEFLQQHPAASVLLPRDSALANMLLKTRGWNVFYQDEVAIAFVRISESR